MAGSTYTVNYVKYIKCQLKKAPERPPYWKALESARRLLSAMKAGHVGIEWSYSGALICPMAESTYTVNYVKYINHWLKKGAGTDAILEGVRISAPLMGRYVGLECGYRMVS